MIKGKAIAKFGSGSILITPVLHTFEKGTKNVAIVLQSKDARKVGERVSSDYFKREEDDTVLFFTNSESIDVVIDSLKLAKEMLNGNLDDCVDTKINYWDLIEEVEQ